MIFEETEKFYEQNNEVFNKFERFVNAAFDIDNDTSSRTIKRILVQFISKRSRIDIFSRSLICISCFFLFPLFIYLLVLYVLSKKDINKTTYGDIIFDCWGNNNKDNKVYYERFYKKLKDMLVNKKIAILEPNMPKKNHEVSFSQEMDAINYSYRLDRIIIGRIIKYFTSNIITIIKLSLQSNINFILIFTKILRQFIYHQRNVQKIKNIEYLISAGDNYYTPLMYAIYKKNSIQNILLIQNGFRTEESDSAFYITCDNYFSLNTSMIPNYLGLKAKCIDHIGSLRLYNSISNININEQNYDIVFIETIAENSILNNKNHSLYNLMINYFQAFELLAEFSRKNNTIKIIYRVKTKDYGKESSTFLQRRNDIIASSNIILDDDIHNNSYEAILDSKVIVYSHSTMGYESILLGKKILCCNFGKFNFLLSQNDEIGVITKKDYKSFEDKLLNLLSDKKEVDFYFQEKRKVYGDVCENPYKIICDNIN